MLALEGILPALETAHAVVEGDAHCRRRARDDVVVICFSGRGDKDCFEVARLRGRGDLTHGSLQGVMNPIDALFQRLRAQGRKAFIPFVTAGDPDLAATELLVRELAGARRQPRGDRLPLQRPDRRRRGHPGVLHAGPGPRPAHRRHLSPVPAAWPIPRPWPQATIPWWRWSPTAWSTAAGRKRSSTRPSRPASAAPSSRPAGRGIARPCPAGAARDFKLIQLVTPTTPQERAVRIAGARPGSSTASSVTGITGERDRLPAELLDQIGWLRRQTELPLCVGFGISKPEHVRMLRDVADGVIVGSALVRRLEKAATRPHRGGCPVRWATWPNP